MNLRKVHDDLISLDHEIPDVFRDIFAHFPEERDSEFYSSDEGQKSEEIPKLQIATPTLQIKTPKAKIATSYTETTTETTKERTASDKKMFKEELLGIWNRTIGKDLV